MRISNNSDGMYLFLFIIPFVLSLWLGDYLRRHITNHYMYGDHPSQLVSTIFGIAVESLTIITGIITGFVFIRLL